MCRQYIYIYMRRKKNDVDKLFEELNSYHENIKLMLEVNSTKFLDTELDTENIWILMQVFIKSTKLPVHWSSKMENYIKPKELVQILIKNSKQRLPDTQNYVPKLNKNWCKKTIISSDLQCKCTYTFSDI